MDRRSFLRLFGLATGTLVVTPVLGTGTAQAHPVPGKSSTGTVKFGSRGAAVRNLQSKLGGVPVTGNFYKLTLGRVIDFQLSKGLKPDGIVGPLTWSYVNDPAKPVVSTPFPVGEHRIVNDKFNNIVYLVLANGTVEGWGWSVDNNTATLAKVTRVSQKIPINRNKENELPGELDLHHFVRFDGGNGFHAIPINRNTGQPIHGVNQLGRGTPLQSKGCVRLEPGFAKLLYTRARRGMLVETLNRL